MITDDVKDNQEIDFGLSVLFEGKKNILIFPGLTREYPVGGLITEFMRLQPTEIKDVILGCSNLSEAANPENMSILTKELQDRLVDHFEPVIAIMVLSEFFNEAVEWFDAVRTGRGEEFLGTLNRLAQGSVPIKDYIFENTGYEELGKETVGQMALSIYLSFAVDFVNVKYTFQNVIDWAESPDTADQKAINLLLTMCSEMIVYQRIDYRIVLIESNFESMYTIRSLISLLVFEIAHVFSNEVTLVKCKNCGHYFVPDGRSDQIYCTCPSPQNPDKTCREIGAQITRANKEKNDVVTKEYRKKYMRYKMLTKRHPENREATKSFEKLTEGMRSWRKSLASGTGTVDQFLDWLSSF